MKHRTTFCYSFYCSGHDPGIAIHEIANFFQYLENSRLLSFVPKALPFKHSSCMTNAARVRAVIRFIGYLIATYVSPYYMNETPKELSRHASHLNTRLLICKEEFKTLERSNQKYYSRVIQGFQSMTADMVENVYRIVVPSSKHKNNFLNPFPSGFIQLRNYLIIRLMLNYGLRVGELLLLECASIKSSVRGDKFSLIISMPRNMTDPRKHAPSLKNEFSHRVLELDKIDYEFLMIYIQRIRKNSMAHVKIQKLVNHHAFTLVTLQYVSDENYTNPTNLTRKAQETIALKHKDRLDDSVTDGEDALITIRGFLNIVSLIQLVENGTEKIALNCLLLLIITGFRSVEAFNLRQDALIKRKIDNSDISRRLRDKGLPEYFLGIRYVGVKGAGERTHWVEL